VSASDSNAVPSFLLLRIGTRRIALTRENVAELVASPVLHTFPHTTPLVSGVILRRGRVLPVLDLGPCILGEPSPPSRFFLVVERQFPRASENCAIPVQGGCELVSGTMVPGEDPESFVTGWLDLNGERVDVLDFERAIRSSAGASESLEEAPS
jgi:chemotaxis signal transduction protein